MLQYVAPLQPRRVHRRAGGKRAGLESLLAMGLRVPQAVVCSAHARRRYLVTSHPARVLAKLQRELSHFEGLLAGDLVVRSASLQEDGVRQSQAGRFESYLHVQGIEQTMDAILRVWRSSGSAARDHPGSAPHSDMETVIQRMIHPVAAGAAFSRDPVTGEDCVIVEAVEGTSEDLLQRGKTPQRWVVRQADVASDWTVLPTGVLSEIVSTTRRVAAELRYPADLEWAYDGRHVWWLQVRPITTLRGLPAYSNRISREYLPGLVKPLVWSINVPMINGAWVDLFERVVGRLAIDPLSLAKQFHYRAYFNMSGMGALFRKLGLAEDTLENLLGLVASEAGSAVGFRWKMLGHLPGILCFLGFLMVFPWRISAWVSRMTKELREAEQRLEMVAHPNDLMNWVSEFLPMMRVVARYRIVALLLHLAIGQLGRKILRRQGQTNVALLELRDERLRDLDPNAGIEHLIQVFRDLPEHVQRQADRLPIEELLSLANAEPLVESFNAFLESFGYLTESGNDFSREPWKENPERILQMIVSQAARENPRQEDQSDPPRRGSTGRWARRVTRRRLDRERIGAVFSRGFYLLHRWANRVGSLLEHEGILEHREDVFLLQRGELADAVGGRLAGDEVRNRISRRRAEMAAAASIALPELILGDRVPVMIGSSGASDHELRGLPVSRGVYDGRVAVVRSLDAASSFRDGDVLVVPFSDVAWTPLFSRAGAIIAEAGGMLSHSAIVARELGIPAVVSVGDACALPDGTRVRVDGLEGRISRIDVS